MTGARTTTIAEVPRWMPFGIYGYLQDKRAVKDPGALLWRGRFILLVPDVNMPEFI
ncbi:MAG TPA: hypothetical protein VFA89_10405 [Terriglobales bacterium]|nr:hypothetical protein [Terriglobales bacterium]